MLPQDLKRCQTGNEQYFRSPLLPPKKIPIRAQYLSLVERIFLEENTADVDDVDPLQLFQLGDGAASQDDFPASVDYQVRRVAWHRVGTHQ